MVLDIAMGGSTNTVLHILAAAQEAGHDFTMAHIDAISRRVPNICKVAPSIDIYHMEDVHRAGGIPGILGELERGGLIDTSVPTVHSATMGAALDEWDIMRPTASPAVEHAYTSEGGLAVLYGNIAVDGCIVKTAGVAEENFVFSGPARVYESQDDAVAGILGEEVVAGECVIVRYEGPKGGPGMQEMLYPTTYIKSRGLGTQCALLTDGRFSGGTSGLSIGHASPEAAAGGAIGLVETGDIIDIDIPNRTIDVRIDDSELARRR
ncbi:UNVERIFIED_CONTAM: hypothetical protein GTU68_033944, partial [Idotea baltica]|nr:hypothetical protein [Idotea baltica]